MAPAQQRLYDLLSTDLGFYWMEALVMTFEGVTGDAEDFTVHFLTHDQLFRLDLGFRHHGDEWKMQARGDVLDTMGWKRLHTINTVVEGPVHYMLQTTYAVRLRGCMYHALKDHAAELVTR